MIDSLASPAPILARSGWTRPARHGESGVPVPGSALRAKRDFDAVNRGEFHRLTLGRPG